MTDTFMFQVIKVTVICPPLMFISSRYILYITEQQVSQEIHYDQKYFFFPWDSLKFYSYHLQGLIEMFTKAECIPFMWVCLLALIFFPPWKNQNVERAKHQSLPGSTFGETSEKSAVRERGKEYSLIKNLETNKKLQ